MNYSTLVGHTVKSDGNMYSGEGNFSYKEKLSTLDGVLSLSLSSITKMLLCADLMDQIDFYTPYEVEFRDRITKRCGVHYMKLVEGIKPSVNLDSFTKTLRTHFIALRGTDKDLCLGLISKYVKKLPNLMEYFSDVLTQSDMEFIENN